MRPLQHFRFGFFAYFTNYRYRVFSNANYNLFMSNLPIPNDAAFAHSNKLIQEIRQEISQSGGHISFARFMELALYAPGLGYYSAGSHKIGKAGDFVTAPEMTPLFAQCVANQCEPFLTSTTDFLEIGAGSGIFAVD